MKNTLEGINNRLIDTEECIPNLNNGNCSTRAAKRKIYFLK